MSDYGITLSRLITQTQTATATDVSATNYLSDHAGMFNVVQGKAGLKVAREWLLGAALLDLYREASARAEKTDS